MISLPERFAQAAERLEGVPFVEHGRDPEVGLDCVGLVLVPAREVGVHFEDRAYVTVPGSDFWAPMCRVLDSAADRMEGFEGQPEAWQRGDVFGSRFGAVRNHLAIYLGDGKVIHSSDKSGIRRAIVVTLDPAHRRMVKAVWRLRP